jgi:hypothetical protein
LQIVNELADRTAHLMTEEQSRERSAGALPGFGAGAEANVLSENHPTQRRRALEQFLVGALVESVLASGQDVDPSSAYFLASLIVRYTRSLAHRRLVYALRLLTGRVTRDKKAGFAKGF